MVIPLSYLEGHCSILYCLLLLPVLPLLLLILCYPCCHLPACCTWAGCTWLLLRRLPWLFLHRCGAAVSGNQLQHCAIDAVADTIHGCVSMPRTY